MSLGVRLEFSEYFPTKILPVSLLFDVSTSVGEAWSDPLFIPQAEGIGNAVPFVIFFSIKPLIGCSYLKRCLS